MRNIDLVIRYVVVFLVWATLLAIPVAPSYAVTGKKPDPEAAKRGSTLYRQYCVSCHGIKGVGGPNVPKSIRRPDYFRPPALNDTEHTWHHTDENLIKTILDGSPRTPAMPAWKKVITKSQARDLVDYIKSLWTQRALECQGPKHMSCM